jgi:hypothetical protein
MTLEEAIKKSIQKYFAGEDVNNDPNAKYTHSYLNNFNNEVLGQNDTKDKTKVAKLMDKVNAVQPISS